MRDPSTKLPKIADALHGEVQPWKPQEAKLREKQAQLLKKYAEAVRDWEMLKDAVDQEISDQQNLDEWWYGVAGNPDKRRHVRPAGQGNNADLGYFLVEEAEKLSGIPQQKISRWHAALKGNREEYADLLRGPSYRKAMLERGSSDQRGASGTGENEWCTPAEYIEAARLVMGAIDLDPATSTLAQELIQAATFYTKQDNGLEQEWQGRVWLNPPYAQPLITEFISKLCDERRAGRVTEAILLTHNYTDTSWFHEIVELADAICFTRGRVKFYEGSKVAAPTQGQAFSYFGANVDRFGGIFGRHGFVVVPWGR
jgi:phage N-6-adenine-methyltransferase